MERNLRKKARAPDSTATTTRTEKKTMMTSPQEQQRSGFRVIYYKPKPEQYHDKSLDLQFFQGYHCPWCKTISGQQGGPRHPFKDHHRLKEHLTRCHFMYQFYCNEKVNFQK